MIPAAYVNCQIELHERVEVRAFAAEVSGTRGVVWGKGGHVMIAFGATTGANSQLLLRLPKLQDVLRRLETASSPEELDGLESDLTRIAPMNVAALQAAASSNEKPSQLRAAALRALIDSNSVSLETLLMGLRDPSARVREVAADGAAAFASQREVADELRRIMETDPSQVIRAIAQDTLAGV